MKYVYIKEENEIGWIKMINPPLNVLNIDVMEEMSEVISSINPYSIKAVVISGEGKAFCAGVDVGEHLGEKIISMMNIFKRMLFSIINIPIPTIAVVDGAALGGGMEVAVACDTIIASERARFGQPEIKLGVFPPFAIAILPYKIGLSNAFDLVISGRIVSSKEARELGIVQYLLPTEEFMEGVHSILNGFREMSNSSLRITKKTINGRIIEKIKREYDEIESSYLNELMKTHDAEEGLKSFVEKRKPEWRNE